MPGLIPKFTVGAVIEKIDNFQKQKEKDIFLSLSFIGEKSVNKARTTNTYEDQTGNLRSSIGYAVILNGDVKKSDITGESDGATEAWNYLDELRVKYNKGFVLVIFAGMDYAAAVESKGYDVITNSVPTKEGLHNDLKNFGLL